MSSILSYFQSAPADPPAPIPTSAAEGIDPTDVASFTTIFSPNTLSHKGLHPIGPHDPQGGIQGHSLYYELYAFFLDIILFRNKVTPKKKGAKHD